MKISFEKAMGIMDGIAFALCNTVCCGEDFEKFSDEELTDYVNNITRHLFTLYCDTEGIKVVEEPE